MHYMADPVNSAIDIDALAALLQAQRKAAGLSLRDLAAETGVPYATLSRVESGKVPDLSTFRSIVDWLGIDPSRFFPTARVRQESTPEQVTHFLRSDTTLTDQARDQLASVFSTMYATLAAKQLPATVHLRAHRAFTPEAGNLLADILGQMETTLTRPSPSE
jgi:transcriptional regulator with XRE-family HTH domain